MRDRSQLPICQAAQQQLEPYALGRAYTRKLDAAGCHRTVDEFVRSLARDVQRPCNVCDRGAVRRPSHRAEQTRLCAGGEDALTAERKRLGDALGRRDDFVDEVRSRDVPRTGSLLVASARHARSVPLGPSSTQATNPAESSTLLTKGPGSSRRLTIVGRYTRHCGNGFCAMTGSIQQSGKPVSDI